MPLQEPSIIGPVGSGSCETGSISKCGGVVLNRGKGLLLIRRGCCSRGFGSPPGEEQQGGDGGCSIGGRGCCLIAWLLFNWKGVVV